ncbi:MAG: helix-turn-helix domain-containing protein [Pseudomonadota bacterium]
MKKAPYDKFRFTWKQSILESVTVPNATKSVAVIICDKFVNKGTGVFFAGNDALADSIKRDVRTVQRHLRILVAAGYLKSVRIPRRRRAYLITIPGSFETDSKHDIQHDKSTVAKVTNLTAENDKTVAPYNNQVCNQEEKPSRAYASYVAINADDTAVVNSWTRQLRDEPAFKFEVLFPLLRRGDQYRFPRRFPREEEKATYVLFFEDVIRSNGKSIWG